MATKVSFISVGRLLCGLVPALLAGAALAQAPGASNPEDDFDVVVKGGLAQVKHKGKKDAPPKALGLEYQPLKNPGKSRLKARVQDRGKGRAVQFGYFEDAGLVTVHFGTTQVVVKVNEDRSVDVVVIPPSIDPFGPPPQTFQALGRTHCNGTDLACIAAAIGKAAPPDLSPEELAALLNAVRADLALLPHGRHILNALRWMLRERMRG